MKTTLDKSTRDELIERIKTLTEKSKAGWGEMNVHEMVHHCMAWEAMFQSKQNQRQTLMGRLFGKMALGSMIGNDKPVKRNMPTLTELKVTGATSEMEKEKRKWIDLLEKNALSPNSNFVHPFFGKMTVDEIGRLAYKHTDHHLRQFNS